MTERDTEGQFGGPDEQPGFFAGGEEPGSFARVDETEGHMLAPGEQTGAIADQHDEDDAEGHVRAPDKAAAQDDSAGPEFSGTF